eukprot:8152880-Pyramimonas_sp.AAC.1
MPERASESVQGRPVQTEHETSATSDTYAIFVEAGLTKTTIPHRPIVVGAARAARITMSVQSALKRFLQRP